MEKEVIEFPLRGEWKVESSPKDKVPSHGTDRMGLRYAIDFLQVDSNNCFHSLSSMRYFFIGIPLNKCYCWAEKIYSPQDGEVVMISDKVNERKRVHWLVDSVIAIKSAIFFNERKHDYNKIAGNYIVIKYGDNRYMLFAHLQKDSINVNLNDEVKKGDFIARVGHSGNSTSPHLHFQIMDSDDIANSKGVSYVFKEYEVFNDNRWNTVYNQVPGNIDKIRFNK